LRGSGTRESVLAGSWYAASKEELTGQIEALFKGRLGPGRIPELGRYDESLVGVISPHAGYVYSGQAAAHAYSEVSLHGPRDVVVLLGPNHHGTGSSISASTSKKWQTPLGEVDVDLDLAKEIATSSGLVDFDETAHRSEHSLEIQLPFLQSVLRDHPFKVVPISLWMSDLSTARELGSSIANALSGRRALVVTSTDMTHYMPADIASKRDRRTLDLILKLDEEGTWTTANELESLCGLGPVLSCMVASKALGATEGRLLSYYNSGDVTGDNSAVVGYAAVAFKRTPS